MQQILKVKEILRIGGRKIAKKQKRAARKQQQAARLVQ